jgi:hypothetical protein
LSYPPTAEALTTLQKGESLHWPTGFLPESGAVLFHALATTFTSGHVEAVRLSSKERTRIVESSGAGWALASGHLLFDQSETLVAAPFDARRLAVTGPAVALGERVRRASLVQQIAVSTSGTLVYLRDIDPSEYAVGRLSADGTFDAFAGVSGVIRRPRATADGRHVAVSLLKDNNGFVQLIDAVRGTATVLSRPGSTNSGLWHPNGRSLALRHHAEDGESLYLRHPDGREQLLVKAGPETLLHPDSFFPDGKVLAYTRQETDRHSLWIVTLTDKPSATAIIESFAATHGGAFSPDGRWLAYVSATPPASDVRVRAYPSGEDVIVARGLGPMWSHDGRTLFFDNDASIMAVPFSVKNGTPDLGLPRVVVSRRTTGPSGAAVYTGSNNQGAGYDVLPDGRFLVVRQPDPHGVREMVVIQDWFEELKRLVPAR